MAAGAVVIGCVVSSVAVAMAVDGAGFGVGVMAGNIVAVADIDGVIRSFVVDVLVCCLFIFTFPFWVSAASFALSFQCLSFVSSFVVSPSMCGLVARSFCPFCSGSLLPASSRFPVSFVNYRMCSLAPQASQPFL